MECKDVDADEFDNRPLVRKVDCLQLCVPDVDAALQFYRDKLGHELAWRTRVAAGLRMPETNAEIVLQTDHKEIEIDLLVDSADDAAARFKDAGGEALVPPFDVQIGRCVVVQDPWGNRLVILDMSKGPLVTDADGNVVTNSLWSV